MCDERRCGKCWVERRSEDVLTQRQRVTSYPTILSGKLEGCVRRCVKCWVERRSEDGLIQTKSNEIPYTYQAVRQTRRLDDEIDVNGELITGERHGVSLSVEAQRMCGIVQIDNVA